MRPFASISIVLVLFVSVAAARPSGVDHDVRRYGAKGDGRTFDDEAIRSAFRAANGTGGTVLFPPGRYRVGKGRAVVLSGASAVSFAGWNAVLFSDTTTGEDGEVIAFRGGGRGITIRGLAFESRNRTASSFDNLVTFHDDTTEYRDIRIIGCEFGTVANKHLHFGGRFTGIVIDSCRFADSGMNAAPLRSWNSFGSVFFMWNRSYAYSRVTIVNNLFTGNRLFCISMNQYDGTEPPSFFDVTIARNRFVGSTHGIVLRGGERVGIRDNVFDAIGTRNILTSYRHIQALNRFHSSVRAEAGTTADTATTVKVDPMPVLYLANAADVSITGNTFDRSAFMQSMPYGRFRSIVLSLVHCRSVVVTGNTVRDELFSESTHGGAFFVMEDVTRSTVEGNMFPEDTAAVRAANILDLLRK